MKNSTLNFDEFKKVDFATWREAAQTQLKGKNPENELKWSSSYGIPLQAYYDESSTEGLAYLADFFSDIKAFEWKLFDRITVTDTGNANKEALESLNGGCDGVIFDLGPDDDFKALTHKILFEHCHVCLICSESDVASLIEQHRDEGASGFIVDRASPYVDDKQSLDSIAGMLVEFAKDPVQYPVVYRVIGADFFHELAITRAIRYLLTRVSSVLGTSIDPNNIWIHCQTLTTESFDDNQFMQTTSGLAAAIGGANSISFSQSEGNSRISRNVGNLIRHESNIHLFKDAGGGSYFVDYLTDQVVRMIWEKFQKAMA